MKSVVALTICLTVLSATPSMAGHPASVEQLAFRFIEKAFLAHDEAAVKSLLAPSQRLLDGKQFSVAETLKSIRYQHSNDDRITRAIESVFFVRNRKDLKAVLEYWMANHPERAGKEVRRTKQGKIDIDRTCAGRELLLEERKDFVKCVVGIRTALKTDESQSEVRFMFLLCERIDNKWLVTGVDDG